MTFFFDEYQQQFRETISKLLSRRDVGAAGPALWNELGEHGVFTVPVPEEFGGMGGGFQDIYAVCELAGSAAIAEPVVATMAAARLIASYGGPELRRQILPRVAEGNARLAIAFPPTFSKPRKPLILQDGAAPVLSGQVQFVIHGATASHILAIASAVGRDRPVVCVVDGTTPGLRRSRYSAVDGRDMTLLDFASVALPPEGILAAPSGRDILSEATSLLTALFCAESVGAMQALLGMTTDYLMLRRQFGMPLASFQVLQHRVADMYMAVEEACAITMAACERLETAPGPQSDFYVSAAKVKVVRAGRLVGSQAIQLHGGIGMTDELGVGQRVKRLEANAQILGGETHHLERITAYH